MPLESSTTTTTKQVVQASTAAATIVLVGFLTKYYWMMEKKKKSEDSCGGVLRFHGRRPPINTIIGKVTELNIFPGKSMAGCSLTKCQITNAGLTGDRLIMVVRAKNNLVITQRMIPQLCLISATLKETDNNNKEIVTLSASDCSPLEIDLSKLVNEDKTSLTPILVDLHSIKAQCVDLGDEAAKWINTAINKVTGKASDSDDEYRLYTLAPNEFRKVSQSPAQLLMENARNFDATRLSDLAPITVASESSLNALNKNPSNQGQPPVTMDRFRTNIVISFNENENDQNYAFLEDTIRTIQIGSDDNNKLLLHSLGPTFRCVIPTIDQTTGDAGWKKLGIRVAEPIATLKQKRSGGIRFGLSGTLPVEEGGSKGLAPLFGIYMGVDEETTVDEIHVGDPIRIVQYKNNNIESNDDNDEPNSFEQFKESMKVVWGMAKYKVTGK